MSSRTPPTDATKCSVTVLMTAYNAESTVEAAIRSILHQTYRNWPLLVIDDGSTDRTADICQGMAREDGRITVMRPGRLGFCSVLNLGLKSIQTRYVARLDADDIAYPNRLEMQMQFLASNPQVKVLATL